MSIEAGTYGKLPGEAVGFTINRETLRQLRQKTENRLTELFRQTEKLPVVEQNVVRVLAQQMLSPDEIVAGILPELGQADTKKTFESHCFDKLYFTSSAWLLKGPKAKNPNQMMLLGGKIKPGENTVQAAVSQLQSEGHVYGVDPDSPQLFFTRDYSFRHPTDKKPERLLDHESTCEAEIPPFLIPRAYDPADKAEDVKRLAPDQVKELLFKEHLVLDGKTVDLLDSLCEPENRPAHVQTDNRTRHLKSVIEHRINEYDMQIEIEVIDKFLEITSISEHVKEKLIKDWKTYRLEAKWTSDYFTTRSNLKRFLHNYEKNLSAQDINPSQYIDEKRLSCYRNAHIEEDSIRKRIKLSQELKIAAQLVSFEHSMPFIEKSGPQKSFLLAQQFLKLDKFDEQATKVIDTCPELKIIYDSACIPFGIDRSKPGWEIELKDNLREYRTLSDRVLNNQASAGEIQDFRAKETLMEQTFCQGLKTSPDEMITPDIIASLGYSADSFQEYIGKALSQIADSVLRARLVSSRFNNWNSLDELILGYFGIGYPEETPFDFTIQYQTVRKLLLMINYQHERQLWNEHIQKDNKLFDRFFEVNFEAEEDKLLDMGQDTVFYRSRFRESVELTIHLPNGRQLEINQRPAFYGKNRIKNPISGMRKRLERGGENERSDNNGRIYVLDDQDFWEQFVKDHDIKDFQNYQNAIFELWVQAVVSHLVRTYASHTKQFGYNYDCKSKLRKSGILTDIISDPVHSTHSRASDDSGFSWLKFVHSATSQNIGYQEEIQIFPSIEDARTKIAGDLPYDLERLFVPYVSKDRETNELRENRFPLMLVLYGVQGILYKEVVKQKQLKNPRV